MSSHQKPFAERFPKAVYWLDLGLPPKAARELARAGFESLDDLQGKSREEMLAIPGMGQAALALCEQRLGIRFPSAVEELRERGIPLYVVHGLARAGFDTFEKVSRLTREQYLAQPGLGDGGMRKLEAVLGRRLDSPVEELCRQGLPRATAYRLSSAGVRQVAELADRPDSDLRSLGLTPGDITECRRLLPMTGKGRR